MLLNLVIVYLIIGILFGMKIPCPDDMRPKTWYFITTFLWLAAVLVAMYRKIFRVNGSS